MTELAEQATPGVPAPGWYTDPGGSGGQRWWNGAAWTVAVQPPPAPPALPPPPPLPAPPVPAPAPAPTPVAAFDYVATAQPSAPAAVAVNQFGTPIDATPVAAALPPMSAAAAVPRGEPAMSGRLIAGIVVALVLSLAVSAVLWSRMHSGSGSGDSAGGPRGPAAMAAARSDALSLAAAEETYYNDHQAYAAVPSASGIVVLDKSVAHLSADDSATVTVNPSGTGYCLLVTSTSPTSHASSTVVYVSTAGGLQPSLVTTCPANY